MDSGNEEVLVGSLEMEAPCYHKGKVRAWCVEKHSPLPKKTCNSLEGIIYKNKKMEQYT